MKSSKTFQFSSREHRQNDSYSLLLTSVPSSAIMKKRMSEQPWYPKSNFAHCHEYICAQFFLRGDKKCFYHLYWVGAIIGYSYRSHHCSKNVRIQSFFKSIFPRIWTEYFVNLRIQSNNGKMRTWKNTIFRHFLRSASWPCSAIPCRPR